MVRVLFLCHGNICRSPTAEGVFRALCEREGLADVVACDSAGLVDAHVGEAPDLRTQKHARARGYELRNLRSRLVHARDFAECDLVLCMDGSNLDLAQDVCPPEHWPKVRLLMDFAPGHTHVREVPDPYYGGPSGFELVLDLCEDACRGLLDHLKETRLAA